MSGHNGDATTTTTTSSTVQPRPRRPGAMTSDGKATTAQQRGDNGDHDDDRYHDSSGEGNNVLHSYIVTSIHAGQLYFLLDGTLLLLL
jgi:hypothetical protein